MPTNQNQIPTRIVRALPVLHEFYLLRAHAVAAWIIWARWLQMPGRTSQLCRWGICGGWPCGAKRAA